MFMVQLGSNSLELGSTGPDIKNGRSTFWVRASSLGLNSFRHRYCTSESLALLVTNATPFFFQMHVHVAQSYATLACIGQVGHTDGGRFGVFRSESILLFYQTGISIWVRFFQICVQYLMCRCISCNSCPTPSECKHGRTISNQSTVTIWYIYIYIRIWIIYVIILDIHEYCELNCRAWLGRQFGNLVAVQLEAQVSWTHHAGVSISLGALCERKHEKTSEMIRGVFSKASRLCLNSQGCIRVKSSERRKE